MTRDEIIAFIIQQEGGFVDNPADPGGATNMGITQHYLDNARKVWPNLPVSVTDLTFSQVASLYESDEWVTIHGDQLPPVIGLLVMDEAVNGGPGTAAKLLQEALGITADGVIGAATIAAAAASRAPQLALEYAARRAVFYAKLEDNEAMFELGWMRRLLTVYTRALAPGD